ncbi:type I secretion system permease/ATPase [Tabrizicola oligotrophica]|uniref:Type I secretion system permease/ATPase n=1 Tax=Tabrizicola oligotrophica TaxID=2710650 RepID=A0A6M0QPT2_9RHOB|nr:type I secretion system permease/ATPase [Tabrizicola oligotrophica]NEY89488.1 type I secretion system permease/ATPase [Tabrizicola oligotrophica]
MTAPSGMDRFSGAMRAVRGQFPALVLLSCILNLLLLVTSIYMLQVYDRVLSSGSLDTLLWLTLVAVFAIVIYGVLEQSRRKTLARMSGWLDAELTVPVLRRAMETRLAGKSGGAGPREVADLRRFYGGDTVLAFLDAPWSIVFLCFIWLLHPALGLFATLGAIALLGLAIANDSLTREGQLKLARVQKVQQDNATHFVGAGETIGPLGMARNVFGAWGRVQSEIAASQQGLADKTTVILSVARTLRQGLQIGILGLGAYLVLGGEATAGAMIASSIVMGRALAPIERATTAWRSFVAARAARASLAELFADVARAETARVALPRPTGQFAFENVLFAPPGSSEPLLQNLSFSLDPGQNCAVLGPSGAGKSTLCRLAVGAWPANRGHVRLDGADVFDWNPEDLGPHIGYLPQQVELLPGTVAQNIARFRDIESAAVVQAARLAGVHELILSLPNGYETEISLHSQRVSLGQKQRLALARAVYGNPAFVVLDEPNANLDEIGDRALIETLGALKRAGTTVLIVTHQASVLKCADMVLAIRDGTVAAFGPRDQILKPVRRVLPMLPASSKIGIRETAALDEGQDNISVGE